MTAMRAAVLRQHGQPPEHGSHPVPLRGPGEVLIRVTAAPVNPLDLLCASGTPYLGPPALPYVRAARLLRAGRVVAACREAHGRARAAFASAAPRGGTLPVLGYTNNALSAEQKSAALAEVLGHAAAGHLTTDLETLPLDRAAEAWSRCGQAPHRRAVLIP